MNSVLNNFKNYPLSKLKAWADFENSIKLDWNESDESIPQEIIDKSITELRTYNLNWYPPILNLELEQALSSYVKLESKYIRYGCSSDVIHEYLCLALINPNDKVLILNPTYDNFRKTAELNRAQICYFDLDKNFELNEDKFIHKISSMCPSIVYIVNPNNPTGSTVDSNFIERIVQIFPNTYFIIDEAYFEFYGFSSFKLVTQFDNIIITRSLSKAFGAASIRFGYTIASEKIISNLDKVINPKNIPLFTQIMAKNIFLNYKYIQQRIIKMNENKQKLIQIFDKKSIQYLNSSANFLFVKCNSEDHKLQIINALENEKIYVRNYSHLESTLLYFRITIGSSEKFIKVLNFFENNF